MFRKTKESEKLLILIEEIIIKKGFLYMHQI